MLSSRHKLTHVVVLLLNLGLASVTSAQQRHAIVFSPGTYQSLPKAPCHIVSAKRVRDQLLQNGFDQENIQFLAGESATKQGLDDAIGNAILRVASGDVFVVYIGSTGFHFDNVNYVAAYETRWNPERQQLDNAVTLRWLLNALREVTQTKQLVVVDGYGELGDAMQEGQVRFARAMPTPAGNQVLVASRDRKLVTRDQSTFSVFTWSFLDGLDAHADTNRDGGISLLEISEYMATCAEDARVSLPRIAGKMSGSDAIFRVAPPGQTRNATALNDQARELIKEATQALFLELDSRSAINLLDRAKRLSRNPRELQLIKDFLLTANVLHGGLEEMVERLPSGDRPWQLIVHQDSTAYYLHGSTAPRAQLPVGTLVQIKHKRDGGWLEVGRIRRPVIENGQLGFAEVDLETPGFVKVVDFGVAKERSVPSRYLQQQLRLLSPDSAPDNP